MVTSDSIEDRLIDTTSVETSESETWANTDKIITSYAQIEPLVKEIYSIMFPNKPISATIKLVPQEELNERAGNDGRGRGGLFCPYEGVIYLPLGASEYRLLRAVGHELGHNETSRLSGISILKPRLSGISIFLESLIRIYESYVLGYFLSEVLDEAKAYLFQREWEDTIIKHNIGGYRYRANLDIAIQDRFRESGIPESFEAHDEAYHLAIFAKGKYSTFSACCKHLRELAKSEEFKNYYAETQRERDLPVAPFF